MNNPFSPGTKTFHKCPICSGSGVLLTVTSKEVLELCPKCWGKGQIELVVPT